ncbi:MAG: VIT family protein [Acidimicrobiales bacterium]
MSPSRPHASSENHQSHRAVWLRAAVLGADDGIVSTASLMIGVAATQAKASAVITAGIAGLAAGALSMAAGEYVSVSSQRDTERSDLQKERRELIEFPEAELRELTEIYVGRGLDRELAGQVAHQLHEHDALGAHIRDELRLDPNDLANPVQAAVTSALAFCAGALVPLVVGFVTTRPWIIALVALLTLGLLGIAGARVGGADQRRAALRVLVGGGLAMGVTALIGSLVGGVV